MSNSLLNAITITALFGICGDLRAHDFFWGNAKNSHISSVPFSLVETTPYQIIPRPMSEHDGKKLPYSSTIQATPAASLSARPTKPYAYGWFGPKETPQWQRHFGYHSRYTQWTLK